jgi:hypothetical protein
MRSEPQPPPALFHNSLVAWRNRYRATKAVEQALLDTPETPAPATPRAMSARAKAKRWSGPKPVRNATRAVPSVEVFVG